MATLTGACRVALGGNRAGLFSNSDELSSKLSEEGVKMDELVWRLPVDEYHYEMIKSKQADITNSAGKPDAAASQAAAFLGNFVEEGVEWAHLDIAGVGEKGSYSTGFGAKLMLDYVKNN